MNDTWPHSEKLKNAEEYIYFWRHWMDQGGSDCVLWWKLPDGTCHCFCQATGEQWTPEPPGKILIDRQVKPSEFDKLMAQVADLDVFGAQSQDEAIVSSNASDYLSIKMLDKPVWSVYVRGGIHRVELVNELTLMIILSAPELIKFHSSDDDE